MNKIIIFKYRRKNNNSLSDNFMYFSYVEDAGTYACTATNSLGSTVTSANLEVPGNRRSIYVPIS